MRPRLLTIPLSHYCERARWALDFAGIDYDEVHTLQFCVHGAVRAAGGKRTVPVLVTKDAVLADSSDIVAFASGASRIPLYPSDPAVRSQVERYEHDLAGAFGDAVRRVTYQWFFRSWPGVLPYNDGAAPRWQRLAIRVGGRPMMPFVKRYLDMSAAKVAESRAIVDETMEEVASRLADGRPYLFGDKFTAADLTFASLFAIAVLPDRYGMRLPPLEAVRCPEGQAFVSECRRHPAGCFVDRMYQERPNPRHTLQHSPSVSR